MARASTAWSVQNTAVPARYVSATAAATGFAPEQPKMPVGEHDPFRLSVVKLWCFAPGDSSPRAAGTGVFISNEVILTVGHVVFDPAEYGDRRDGGYVDFVRITSPWFPIPPAFAQTPHVVAAPGWTGRPPRREFDVGLIRLKGPVAGINPLFPQARADSDLGGAGVAAYGFPSVSQQLYRAVGTCVGLQPQLIYHTADVSAGESGSPLLAAFPSGPELVGLHRAGPGETPSGFPASVSAFRLTAQAIGWINGMIANLGG